VSLLSRLLLLVVLSVGGIALLAPLAARSAPVPIEGLGPADRLLSAAPAVSITAERGNLSARLSTAEDAALAAPERLDEPVLPTPAVAPMEATLHAVATPPPTPAPAPVAATPAPRPAAATPAPRLAAATPAPRPSVTYSGDSVWDDLARCESGGNWAINTGNGYYGGLQFSYGTWHDYGGGAYAAYPHQASREEQIAVAERLRAARGYAPWPACRSKLGLP
jgi:hypothetical protein